LKNKEGQAKFKAMTSKPGILSAIFKDKQKDLENLTKTFLKKLDRCLHQCFTKIRVKDIENKELENLFNQRRILRSKSDKTSIEELNKVNKKLEEVCAEDNYRKIKQEIKDIESEEGGMNAGKLWSLKKKLSPRGHDPPHAMVDSKGNIVTSEAGLEKIATDHYKKNSRKQGHKRESQTASD
jgi:hypothetical protein